MGLRKLAGRVMFGKLDDDLAVFGESIEQRLIDRLDAQPMERYSHLHDLRNLDGESTGRVHTYTADRMDRFACISIDILPGMRYFNIHAMPDTRYLAPRYSFEGMVSTRGSQLSMDLYPDIDMDMQYDFIRDNYRHVAKTWEAAKQHKTISIEPSRLAHLRATCSPYFLLANKVAADDMSTILGWAGAYLDEWFRILENADELGELDAESRLRRRQTIARTIIEHDPDRYKVVAVYGEETTQSIEEASML